MSIASETDLWQPIKSFFEDQGYAVRSEVNGCDVVASKGATLIAAELKRSFNLSLVLQGMERQRVVDYVYLVVEMPKRRGRRWRQIRRLCKRLDLGLLLVSFAAHRKPIVEIDCEPGRLEVGRSHVGRARLEREIAGRSGDYNVGGSTGRPIVTAYREEALLIARELHEHETLNVKALREATGIERAGPILQKNYYGWFERVERGTYTLTSDGVEALEVFAEVIAGWDEQELV